MKNRLSLFFFAYGLLLAATGLAIATDFSDTHRLLGGYMTAVGAGALGVGWWVRGKR